MQRGSEIWEVMAEKRDPAIKLFGKTIPLQPSGLPVPVSGGGESREGRKDLQKTDAVIFHQEHGQESSDSPEKFEFSTSISSEISLPDSADKEGASVNHAKSAEQTDNQNPPEEKKLKKPDKILPCPRCNSMETKFCYYNNYNVNQPRHFCKNCQRYWTAGGTMRNVPVGAGRRKNKSSTTHYRHIIVSSSSLQAIPESISYPPKPSSTVLSFGSDTPFCDPVAPVLNLADRIKSSSNLDGFHQMVEKVASSSRPVGYSDENSSLPSAAAQNSKMVASVDSQSDKVTQTCGITPCINGSPWPYPWIPSPLCPPSYPIPIYPAALYWNCTASSGAWTVPWLPLAPESSLFVNDRPQGASLNSPPALDKHSGDGIPPQYSNTHKRHNDEQDNQERSIWAPKTLRIDDPKEAARSSIWAMFGAKHAKSEESSGRGLSKAFHPKLDIKNHAMEASEMLIANPAALSRSMNFQESI